MSIHDLVTRIRNACMIGAQKCRVRYSKFNLSLLECLQKEGYIVSYDYNPEADKYHIEVVLKYTSGENVSVIRIIKSFRKNTTVDLQDIKKNKYRIDRFATMILTTTDGVKTYDNTSNGGTLLIGVAS